MRGVCLAVEPGETLALVGETGSGKSSAVQAVPRLLPAGARMRAERLCLHGTDLLALREPAMARVRGRRIGMIFQDPATALNPTMTVGRQVAEVIALHLGVRAAGALRQAADWLRRVGLAPERAADYPHRLSGGMRQRAAIAMALAGRPSLLIADEPTAALDPTVGAQIVDLLADLRRDGELAMILVSHDLGLVARVADRVGVMYAGEVVEAGGVQRIFEAPAHPYTQGLLAAAAWRRLGGPLRPIPGEAPDPQCPGPGCAFAPRCPRALRGCHLAPPALHAVAGEADRFSRCWLHDPRAPDGVRWRAAPLPTPRAEGAGG